MNQGVKKTNVGKFSISLFWIWGVGGVGNKKSREWRIFHPPAGPNFVRACRLLPPHHSAAAFVAFCPLPPFDLSSPLLRHSEHCWQAAMQGDERGLHYNCKTPHATRGEEEATQLDAQEVVSLAAGLGRISLQKVA